MEYFVKTIFDIEGDVKRKSSVEFLAIWLNHDEEYNILNPYSYF